MLGLPRNTEIKKQLSKNAIYSRFILSTKEKESFDEDIKRMTIVNEVSPDTISIAKGNQCEVFFVILITLKRKEFDERNITLISKLINQNMLFVLEYEDKAKIAVYYKKLLQTDWMDINNLTIELKGLNFDTVWENIVTQIGNITIEDGNTLLEQIEKDDKHQKIENKIKRLERKAWNEKQPKKKLEIAKKIEKLKSEEIYS